MATAAATRTAKKAIGLDWQNDNSALTSRFFIHFFAVVARLRHGLPNLTRPLYGVREHNAKVSFNKLRKRKCSQHLAN